MTFLVRVLIFLIVSLAFGVFDEREAAGMLTPTMGLAGGSRNGSQFDFDF